MTLHKAIEAARELINSSYAAKTACGCHSLSLPNGGVKCLIHQALSTLPAKPMSEEDFISLFRNAILSENSLRENAICVLTALRDAGVLYVEEK